MKILIKVLILAIAIAVIAYLLFYFADVLRAPDFSFELNPRACYKNYCFDVELAKTAEERSQGLMFRQELDKNKGMLFVFEEEEVYPFWMKNTWIPLDIIWLSKDGQVAYISKNSQTCDQTDCPTINPEVKAKYVLEINAGLSEQMGIKIGDKLFISP